MGERGGGNTDTVTASHYLVLKGTLHQQHLIGQLDNSIFEALTA